MKKYFLLLLLFLYFGVKAQQQYTISGFVQDASSGEQLLGVNVVWKDKMQGTTTNTYGFYSITLPEGDLELVYSYIGFEKVVKKINLQKDLRINMELKMISSEISEVTILGEETVVDRTQTSIVEIPVQQIKNIPALLGEVDVLKAIQLLPGVQSGGEGSSGFYVRGGGPDQNLILLDGVPVYNASHLFGFFSVFNADAIKNVRLTKGGFPARFGGRLSSVLEIDMKEGNMKKIEGEGSIGIVASKLTLQGPIVKDRTSFIFSGRRTYIDLLAKPFIKRASEGNNSGGYFFYDFNAKLNHKFSEKDRLYLSAYSGKDRFYVGEKYTYEDYNSEMDMGLNWGNITSALRWNHLFSNKLFANTTLTYSRYFFDTNMEDKSQMLDDFEEIRFRYYSGIEDYGAKIDFDYLPNPNHHIRFGTNYTYHTFSPGSMELYQRQNNTISQDTSFNFSETQHAHESSLYFEDEIKISDRIKANIGLRYNAFHFKNDVDLNKFLREEYLYFFNKSNDTKVYRFFEPRFSARYLINKKWSLKTSYAGMQQNIHLLSNTSAGLPTDIWVPSTDSVPSQHSRQVAGAVNYLFKNGFYELTIEGYYKTMTNLITLSEGARIIGFDDWQEKVETGGLGKSYGAEFFLQKKKGKTTGWIGYTLAWSWRKFKNVNQGDWYSYKYDRRHDVSLVFSHKLNKNIDIGLTWVYGTGANITMMDARYPEVNSNGNMGFLDHNINEIEYYSSRNNYRLAPYHRLDVGVNFHKKKKWGERTWNIGAYNTYNRKNPYYIYITDELSYDIEDNVYTSETVAKQVSLFPIIPSVSYHFKF